MSYSLIANTYGVSTDGGYNAVTGSIDTTGANLIVIALAERAFGAGGGTSSTLTDSKSNTWTLLDAVQGNFNERANLYYCLNPTVGSGHTFTAAHLFGFESFPSLYVAAFSGAHAGMFDAIAHDAGVLSSSLATGAITAGANELVISILASLGSSYSVDSGLTITDQQNFASGSYVGGALAYKIQGATGSINPTWTQTGNSMAVSVASTSAALVTRNHGFFRLAGG